MGEKFGEKIERDYSEEKKEITIRDVIKSPREGGVGIKIRMQAITGKATQEGSVGEIGDRQLIEKYKKFESNWSFGRDKNHIFRLLKSHSRATKNSLWIIWNT